MWIALVMAALFVASLFQKDPCLRQTAGAILAAWAINMVVYLATGDQFNWPAMAAIDYTAAVVIMSCAFSRWAAVVVAFYGVMLIADGGFGIAGRSVRADYYWYWTQWWASMAQLIVIGGWLGHSALARRRRGIDRGLSSLPYRAVRVEREGPR